MNTFSNELKNLLSKADIKNSTIAEAVKYDISYISKWLSGRVTPSERYIDRIVAQIAECVVEDSSEANLSALCSEFDVSKDSLYDTIIERLLAAYKGETDFREDDSFWVTTSLFSVINELPWIGEIVIAADVFSMEHESRLLFAGIHHGTFIGHIPLTSNTAACPVKMLVCIDSMRDKIYDPIFLIHMMTSFSNTSIELYDSAFSAGRIVYADDAVTLSAHLLDKSHVLSVIKHEDTAIVSKMKSVLEGLCTQESLLVRNMDNLLDGYVYMQSILSSTYDWITGHFTEQMIPEDLFRILSANIDTDNILQMGFMLRDAASKARILIYRSAFTKFLLNGELDFFNQKVILTPEQQVECIVYMRQLAESGRVRIIDGGFSSDFQHISDPCVFLADSVDYIRLENGKYKNNLWSIVNRDLRNIYHKFFDEVWDNGGAVVVKEKDKVLNIIDLYKMQ